MQEVIDDLTESVEFRHCVGIDTWWYVALDALDICVLAYFPAVIERIHDVA